MYIEGNIYKIRLLSFMLMLVFATGCNNIGLNKHTDDSESLVTENQSDTAVPEYSGALKIWTAGDSITYEYRGYRCGIWEMMSAAGNELDFVGTQHFDLGPYSRNPDEDHDGYRGYNIKQWRAEFSDANNGKLQMMQAEDPDVLLLMLGTNNFGYQSQLVSDTPVETSVYQMMRLVDQIFEWFDDIAVVVGTIPPMADATFPNTHTRAEYITAYNALLMNTVKDHSLYHTKLFISDNYSALTYPDDFQDQLHPNAAGHDKIAGEWMKAISAYLALPERKL